LERCLNKETALIKISNKHSKLRLSFEHPIILNPEKKYKLRVTHLLFSSNKTFDIKNFMLEFIVPITSDIAVTIKNTKWRFYY